jgi:hypothetical protein
MYFFDYVQLYFYSYGCSNVVNRIEQISLAVVIFIQAPEADLDGMRKETRQTSMS